MKRYKYQVYIQGRLYFTVMAFTDADFEKEIQDDLAVKELARNRTIPLEELLAQFQVATTNPNTRYTQV